MDHEFWELKEICLTFSETLPVGRCHLATDQVSTWTEVKKTLILKKETGTINKLLFRAKNIKNHNKYMYTICVYI